MTYLETSVALAHLLFEDRRPPDSLWEETLVSSRLLEYEVWTRINARDLAPSHREHVNRMLAGIAFLEMDRTILARALEPFPVPVRTLDAMHLATLDYLRAEGQQVQLASYDARLNNAARALRIPLFPL